MTDLTMLVQGLISLCLLGNRVTVSLVMRKMLFAYAKKKSANQLCDNPTADLNLCFLYIR